MESGIVLFVLLLEIGLVIKRPQYGIAVLITVFCLFQVNLGLTFGIRMNIMTLSVTIFTFAAFLNRREAFNQHFDKSINVAIVIYCIYVFIFSIIGDQFSKYEGDYFRNMIAFVVGYIIVGVIVNKMIISEKDYKFINNVLLILILVIGSYGIYNYLLKWNPYIAFITYITNTYDMSNDMIEEERGFLIGRASSTFIHPLMLGQVSVIILSYYLYELSNKKKFQKLLAIIAIFLLVLMCVLCGSRSALIPLVVVFFIFVLSKDKLLIIKYGLIFLVVGFFSLSIIPEDIQESLKGFLFFWDDTYAKDANIQGSNLNTRLLQLDRCIAVISNSPIFGYGQGYVSLHGHDHPEMKGYESYLFQFLVDGGVLGFLAFTLFYFRLYYIALQRCELKSDKCRVHSLCFTYFISIFFTGIQGTFLVFMTFFCLVRNSIALCRRQQ